MKRFKFVVPYTALFGDRRYPFEVLLQPPSVHYREDSAAHCSQILTASIEDRITDILGGVPAVVFR